MSSVDAFWIDREYDRDNADIGTSSRYGNYLRQRPGTFTDIAGHGYDDPTALFVEAAWRIANNPIMVPGLVRWHRRILSASIDRSSWDGQLVADVVLATGSPSGLPSTSKDGQYWRGWWEPDTWRAGPGEDDIAKHPYMLASVRLLWTLPEGAVSPIRGLQQDLEGPNMGAIYGNAKYAVVELVRALNREVSPVLARLEGEAPW